MASQSWAKFEKFITCFTFTVSAKNCQGLRIWMIVFWKVQPFADRMVYKSLENEEYKGA